MTREHLDTALDALDYYERNFQAQHDREPMTRSGKPNLLRAMLEQDLARIEQARNAIANLFAVDLDGRD